VSDHLTTKRGGSETGSLGPIKQLLPTEKTPAPKNTIGLAKKIAAGSNEDHAGGLPKGTLRGGFPRSL
jgi:hypothetical protein